MKKEEIAAIFIKMAEILEMQDVAWKPQAYRVAARSLEDLDKDVTEIYKKGGLKAIEEIPGVGEGIGKKIIEYIETGKIKEFEKLKKSLPSGLLEMMNVLGIGPKKAKVFYQKLGIKNIKELRKAAQAGKIHELPMFKEKTEENILENIKLYKGKKKRIPFKTANKEATKILNILKKVPGVKRCIGAGSLRRKLSTIGDIDLLVTSSQPKKAIDKFTKVPGIKKVLAKGQTKAVIILNNNLQVDLRVIPDAEFGAALQYFTGNKGHNILLRRIAIKKGYKLNEYGLFKGKKRIAGKTEKEIYNKLGLKMPKPEKRVGKEELKQK
jgi:DNA polymerase (family 10)